MLANGRIGAFTSAYRSLQSSPLASLQFCRVAERFARSATLFLFYRQKRKEKFKMLKKTITYTDYNDVERTETFWFNLSQAELMEMELGTVGGMREMVNRIVAAQDLPSITKVFKDLILKSYGEKSPDGKRFIKSPELSEAFSQTEAYTELFMELATDADAASDFMNGIVPKKLAEQMKEQQAQNTQLSVVD
jgi:hypothetical protein